jgi:lipoprotein-releasing system permease protein
MLGTDLAHALGVFEGDTLLVIPPEGLLLPPTEAPKFERVRIQQVITTNVPEVDGQQIFYMAGSTLRTLRDSASRRLGFEVRWPDPDQAWAAKEELSGFSDVLAQTWKERNSALFLALRLEKVMIGIFLGMAALVAGLSLVSVLTLLISQKRREIGLLQALGYSSFGVRRLFTRLGWILALMGLGSGLFLGTLVSLYLEWHPLNILPDIYYDSEIPAEVQFPFVLLVAVVGLGLAGFGARWAASSTVEASPSELLMGRRH